MFYKRPEYERTQTTVYRLSMSCSLRLTESVDRSTVNYKQRFALQLVMVNVKGRNACAYHTAFASTNRRQYFAPYSLPLVFHHRVRLLYNRICAAEVTLYDIIHPFFLMCVSDL